MASLMDGHAYTYENFRITGHVDFGDFSEKDEGSAQRTEYNNLKVNRIFADLNEDGTLSGNGFYNFRYDAGETGDPWIDLVQDKIEGITFDNIEIHLENSKTSRSLSGLIFIARGFHHNAINNSVMTVCSNTATYCGFISKMPIYSTCSYCTLTNMELKYGVETVAAKNYAGALCGVCEALSYITAEHITVNLPNQSYVGGIAATHSSSNSVSYLNISDVTVTAKSYVYGVKYGNVNLSYANIDNINVYATHGYAAGIANWGYAYYVNLTNATVISDRSHSPASYTNSTVSSSTGGFFTTAYTAHHILLENAYVEGKGAVGGYSGNENYSYSFYNISINNCTV